MNYNREVEDGFGCSGLVPTKAEREQERRDEQAKRARDYARNLAVSLHAKFYPEVTQWKPLPDLLGILTQIDNMTCGLVRKIDE